jgi:serine/threonine protein kinase/Tfp pilus assembly protein PilF
MRDISPGPLPETNPVSGHSSSVSGWQPSAVDSLVEAMVNDWRRGNRTSAEEILASHPELDDEAAVRLVFEETCLRRESGLDVDTSEVVGRFPRFGWELEILLRCDRLMRPVAGVEFPEVGDALGDFDLLLELGRGAVGRTFLASQPALADRPVVLKVMPGYLDEHLSLASLQHTHIVPLYSAQLFPDRGLRGLCMPYLGGSSLAKLLAELGPIELGKRTGRDLLEALNRSSEATVESIPGSGPFRRFLERATYARAICWVAACLADALQYAHDRGLVHMDVKPSNVLIAGDGQPLLLDFHLARAPIEPGEAPFDRLGGTTGWISPEQALAMEALRDGRPIERAVDGRSDVYSLGLLLDRALGGQANPQVSVGLAEIVEKCLKRDPQARYQTAGALADDLRRHLDDRPLRGVPNRSLSERWRKWRRRSPHALIRGTAGLSTLAAGVVASVILVESYRHRLTEVDEALADARRLRQAGQFAEALRSVDRGAELVRPLPGSSDRSRSLREEHSLAIRGEKARGLHDLAELLRFQSGSGPAPALIEGRCRKVVDEWSSQSRSFEGRLDDSTEHRVVEDLAELRRAMGHPGKIPAEARSFDEHRERGRSLLQGGQYEAASDEFRRALDLDPRDFWANFHQGLCDYRLGRFADALAAFRVCVALSPSTPECYFNRALVLEALGKPDLASLDYSRALERAPGLAAAWLNRGILAYKAGQPRQALEDFTRGLRSRPARDLAATLHYHQALARIALGEKTEARESLKKAIELGQLDAKTLLDRLGP